MLSGNFLHSRLSDEWLLLYINFYQTQGTITLKKPLGHFASQSTISLHVKGERLDLNNEKLIFWTHPDLPSKLKFSPHKQQRYHHLSWRFHFELLCSTNSWSSYNSTHTLKILWAKTKQKSWCQISSPLHLVIWQSSAYFFFEALHLVIKQYQELIRVCQRLISPSPLQEWCRDITKEGQTVDTL